MFSKDELNMIYADQIDALENVHGGVEMCSHVAECPPDHFDTDEDIEDIFTRQDIVKKILTKANEEG
ncbi:MAG TPA: hypothetical protein ENI27_02260 [bacterium]|nr:hypothetical protein [bacterium]